MATDDELRGRIVGWFLARDVGVVATDFIEWMESAWLPDHDRQLEEGRIAYVDEVCEHIPEGWDDDAAAEAIVIEFVKAATQLPQMASPWAADDAATALADHDRQLRTQAFRDFHRALLSAPGIEDADVPRLIQHVASVEKDAADALEACPAFTHDQWLEAASKRIQALVGPGTAHVYEMAIDDALAALATPVEPPAGHQAAKEWWDGPHNAAARNLIADRRAAALATSEDPTDDDDVLRTLLARRLHDNGDRIPFDDVLVALGLSRADLDAPTETENTSD